MKKMYIYEGPMCCSTGVCGPSPDEELMRVSTIVDRLTKNGANITRDNLTNDTNEFVDNKIVNKFLNENGEEVLPITMINDEVVITRRYPSNEEFYEMLLLDDDIDETEEAAGPCGCGGSCGC